MTRVPTRYNGLQGRVQALGTGERCKKRHETRTSSGAERILIERQEESPQHEVVQWLGGRLEGALALITL